MSSKRASTTIGKGGAVNLTVINDYHRRDGYRRLTYAMMDHDVAVASPSSVYRILKQADLLN
ncbi:MAG: hypothetical protein LWX56_00490 [Ignavibacteria bacterium]|nr:hypothetical protein [Ignavibacteria bacterium]